MTAKGAMCGAWRKALILTETQLSQERHYLVYHSNPLVAEDIRETLETAGPASVDMVSALDGVPEGSYDIAFLDIAPDALEAQERLRDFARRCGVIVVLTSTLSDENSDREKIVYLPQPFRSDDLLRILASVGAAEADPV